MSELTMIANALVGGAVGDALGWPHERPGKTARPPEDGRFHDWTRSAGGPYRRYDDPVGAGEYSDDTQLAFAVARALCTGDDWWRHWTGVELPLWPLYQRGGGRAVLAAARSWQVGTPPWRPGSSKTAVERLTRYFQAGANGVAMRILPHTMLETAPDDLVRRVVQDGITTHGHPRALVGAALHATSATLLLTGVPAEELVRELAEDDYWGDPDLVGPELPSEWVAAWTATVDTSVPDAWAAAVTETRNLLRQAQSALDDHADVADALRRLGCLDPATNGAGHVGAVAAAYVVARHPDPADLLAATAYRVGADTDTLASMAAGLFALASPDGRPGDLADRVQDAEYTRTLASALLSSRNEHDMVAELQDADVEQAAERARAIGRSGAALVKLWKERTPTPDSSVSLPDGRSAVVDSVTELGDRVRRLGISVMDGQTMFVDVAAEPPSSTEDSGESDAGAATGGTSPTETEATDRREAPVGRREPSSERPRRAADPAPADVRERHRPASAVGGRATQSVQVRLPIVDAERTARFYASVLGIPVKVRDGQVALSNGLILVEAEAEKVRHGVEAFTVLRIAVSDVPDAWGRAAEFGGAPAGRPPAPGETAYLRDPDGYRVAALPG